MIFGCKRTAKVIARKYSNLGRIQRESFKELTLYFPEINDIIKSRIYQYNDKVLKFMKAGIRRIPYFSKIDDAVVFDIMFSMKTATFSKDTIF